MLPNSIESLNEYLEYLEYINSNIVGITVIFIAVIFASFLIFIISAIKPDFINKVNKKISKSYREKTKKELLVSQLIMTVFLFLIGIIYISISWYNTFK